jgi:hypothetical protein
MIDFVPCLALLAPDPNAQHNSGDAVLIRQGKTEAFAPFLPAAEFVKADFRAN